MIWTILIIWLGSWLFSSLTYWIWSDFDVDEDFFVWSMFSFIPVINVLASMGLLLMKTVSYIKERWANKIK